MGESPLQTVSEQGELPAERFYLDVFACLDACAVFRQDDEAVGPAHGGEQVTALFPERRDADVAALPIKIAPLKFKPPCRLGDSLLTGGWPANRSGGLHSHAALQGGPRQL